VACQSEAPQTPADARIAAAGERCPAAINRVEEVERFWWCHSEIDAVDIQQGTKVVGTVTFVVRREFWTWPNSPVVRSEVSVTVTSNTAPQIPLSFLLRPLCADANQDGGDDSSNCAVDVQGDWRSPRQFEPVGVTQKATIDYEWTGSDYTQDEMRPAWYWEFGVPGYVGGTIRQPNTGFKHLKIRCDAKVGNASGCVFTSKIPTLDVSNWTVYGASSAMIWMAQHEMDAAWGLEGKGDPLTRGPATKGEASNTWGDNNRKVICPGSYTRDPRVANGSCDEFPFARSRQSAGAPKDGVNWPPAGQSIVGSGSECNQVTAIYRNGVPGLAIVGTFKRDAKCIRGTIPLSENEAVGGALGRFVQDQRVLTDDPYWLNSGRADDGGTDCEIPYIPPSSQAVGTLAAAGAWPMLCGPILEAFKRGGGLEGVGIPLSDAGPTADGIGQYVQFLRSGESVPGSAIYFSPATGARIVAGAIYAKWAQQGWEAGLGYPTTDTAKTPDGTGWFQHFSNNSSIYYTEATGAHFVTGAIRAKYAEKGWERGLGYPTIDEKPTVNGTGAYQHFGANDSIFWSPSTGAHQIGGIIRTKWAFSGADQGFLGFPTSDEQATSDGLGRYNHFPNGSVFYTGSLGVHSVHGDIWRKWAQLGWERGLGYPYTDETAAPDGFGRFTHFYNLQNKGYASIYWTQSTGAGSVHGEIRDKWEASGWEAGPLGYPINDETGTSDGIGRFNHFYDFKTKQYASVYWTDSMGAFSINGAIRAKWQQLGWEAGVLGYPYTDVTAAPDGVGMYTHFYNFKNGGYGSIYWTGSTGAGSLHGDIRAKWMALGAEAGPLGYPINDESATSDGKGAFNHFYDFKTGSYASVFWSPATGAHAVKGAIRDKWAEKGWEAYGYPTTDELATSDGIGRFTRFQRPSDAWDTNTIYWHPAFGAHTVSGTIYLTWAQYGWERGYGYPKTDMVTWGDAQAVTFERAVIWFWPATGQVSVNPY
jgi:uncharacterized protein with LGFP repeats